MNQAGDQVDGLTAQTFNNHYAAISADADYRAPRLKQTAPNDLCYITEMDVFRMLDTLRPTATGLDRIPACFFATRRTCFRRTACRLFHQSLVTGVMPRQWTTAAITSIPKITAPASPSDFRPISITPVLSRSLERFVVREFFYPALLDISDHFAFRCVQTVWFDDGCHCTLHAVRQRFCSRLFFCLRNGVRHGPACDADEQTDPAGIAGQRLQLGGGHS